MLLKIVCFLLCLSALEAVIPFNRTEYNVVKGYLNGVYTSYKQNTTNKKWLTTHLGLLLEYSTLDNVHRIVNLVPLLYELTDFGECYQNYKTRTKRLGSSFIQNKNDQIS